MIQLLHIGSVHVLSGVILKHFQKSYLHLGHLGIDVGNIAYIYIWSKEK